MMESGGDIPTGDGALYPEVYGDDDDETDTFTYIGQKPWHAYLTAPSRFDVYSLIAIVKALMIQCNPIKLNTNLNPHYSSLSSPSPYLLH